MRLATYFATKNRSEFYQLLTKKRKNISAFKYVAAIFICLFGILLKIVLNRTIHYPEGGFLISTATIMVSAWYGGLGPGLVTVVLNYFIIDWFFITPQALFFQDTLVDQIRIGIFLTEGILISWFFESLHRAHKKTKESLLTIAKNERLFRSLVENVADHAIFLVDAKGNIQTWNEGATKMTGYQTNEILYKPFTLLYPKKTRKRNTLLKNLHLALTKGQHNQEGWKMRKDESLFWAETIITTLPSISSDNQAFSIIIHDTTARKKIDELKNELLSIITHELRTPISIIKVIIEKLVINHSRKQGLENEVQDMLDLNGEVDRLTQLIENIVDLARLRTKKFLLHQQHIELSSLIEKVVSKMRLLAGENYSIIFHTTRNITVFVDQDKIEQVLMNLLDNAIKFTRQKGKIEISAKVVKNMAIVSVLNETNKEIPQDKYLLIFDKFYQLTKKPVKGFGLGLYISREIIKQHHGQMWVNSHKGKGNIFSFSMPMK